MNPLAVKIRWKVYQRNLPLVQCKTKTSQIAGIIRVFYTSRQSVSLRLLYRIQKGG